MADLGGGADPDLPADELRAAFDLGRWESATTLPAGKNQHTLVTTDRGRFALRRSYRAKTPDGLRFEQELVAHLRASGFPGPVFVPTRAGEPFAEVNGRLYTATVFVPAGPYRTGDEAHLTTAARALATYHRLVRDFSPDTPVPAEALLVDSLRERVEAVRALASARRTGGTGDDALAGPLAFALEEGEATCADLERLYPHLALTVIHGGARRGSTLWDGDRLAAVLDFDSARREARAYDVAVAVFDFAKIYGDPASAQFKVTMDPGVAARYLAAYREAEPLAPEEVEALAPLLAAKRLKRALGRLQRLAEGGPTKDGDARKVDLELTRVRWQRTHGPELRQALSA